MAKATEDLYSRERKRFIIELMTGISMEQWEEVNSNLRDVVKRREGSDRNG